MHKDGDTDVNGDIRLSAVAHVHLGIWALAPDYRDIRRMHQSRQLRITHQQVSFLIQACFWFEMYSVCTANRKPPKIIPNATEMG
jgi:hypothetical protein